MDHPVYIFDFAQSRQSTYYNLANCGSKDGEGIFEGSWGGGVRSPMVNFHYLQKNCRK